MDHLSRVPDGFGFSFGPDEDGYLGRECPAEDCVNRYFKITPGTGIQGHEVVRCPYCGHTSERNQFYTSDQVEHMRSVMLNAFSGALLKDLKAALPRSTPRRSRGFGLEITFRVEGRPHPVHYYQERELETEVICEQCGLRYAVYGVFAYCPDCGTHNSLQMLNKNLDLALKKMALAATADPEVADTILADALGSAVAAFDAFGREACRVAAQAAGTPGIADRISFQNLTGAQRNLQVAFAVDLASGISAPQWESICRLFQKRHLFAHSAGVVDQGYLDKTNDPHALLGRKVPLDAAEVEAGVGVLRALGRHLAAALCGAQP